MATSLDVAFIFVQAKRSPSFDTSTIGNIVFAIRDFFSDQPKLPRSQSLRELAKIAEEIYNQSAKFKRANPSCHLFYATTGKWTAESTLDARRKAAISELQSENIFNFVTFECIGA